MAPQINSIEIETDRLRLRPFTMDDLDRIHYIWNDSGVRKFLWDDEPVSREFAESVIAQSIKSFNRSGIGLWAIMWKDDDELIGFCGLRESGETTKIEILYGLLPEHWGKGIATEAARAMLRYGFEELGLKLICAGADPPNRASFRVMEKTGMKFIERITACGLEAIYYAAARDDFAPDDTTYILRRAR
ncbi:MAG TPA: GNAT family N-acetyltransferase [Blastocatellia bacterium]|nr:GNAT family N-acetyltransferase [Blastocatellia bacterium]